MNTTSRHGQRIRLEDILFLDSQVKRLNRMAAFNLIPVDSPVLTNFDYLFKDLANDPSTKLDPSATTIIGLKDLGEKLTEDETDTDSNIPAAYTYLGQFIDHDITLLSTSDNAEVDISLNFFEPLNPITLKDNIKNLRTASFDLDSLYKDAPRNGAQLKLGKTSVTGNIPPHKTEDNDLPRVGGQPQTDGSHRKALIGDHRNDENLVVAQLHLAFIKFHNKVQTQNNLSFEETQKIVRQHYQWIVVNDFLKKVCDNSVIDDIIKNGNKFFKPNETDFFIPIEFTVAAYRFGHSMVRSDYNYNLNFKQGGVLQGGTKATLKQLFQFTGLSGDFVGLPTLPENWIIEWENFLPFNKNVNEKARKINTHLTNFLMNLPKESVGVFQSLAKRNLLRGYLLNLPTGQAIANKALSPAQVLTSDQILNNANAEEKAVLQANNFHIKTPLWYYILSEASIQQNGEKLGLLGSRIVAETIIGLVRESVDSILAETDWKPSLADNFNLESLLKFAGLSPA